MDLTPLLKGYEQKKLTVATLGGHSALDVCHGCKQHGLKTLVVARKGREKTYDVRYKTRTSGGETLGCVDETMLVGNFADVIKPDIQEQLRKKSAIFIHSRYFWVYFPDFAKVEDEFNVPIFGSRHLLRLEERNQPYNQYHLLKAAGIRTPKLFKRPQDIDRPVIVKAAEGKRSYERGFFVVTNKKEWAAVGGKLEKEGKIASNWKDAPIEEFIVGAPVNFNFFYSPLTGELELLGTDTRRQTNLDGFLRLPAEQQIQVGKQIPVKMIETGHVAVTVKESLLEKAFDLGEKFVKACKDLPRKIDPAGKGIIGPFALQGAVVAEEGREDIVIFDVSFRIPGSPGIVATPYSGYLHGHPMSMGERIGLELQRAVKEKQLEEVLT